MEKKLSKCEEKLVTELGCASCDIQGNCFKFCVNSKY